jgi:MscS family membrane protein
MKRGPALLLGFLLCTVGGFAQKPAAPAKPPPNPLATAVQSAEQPPPSAPAPEDPLGRSSPHGCVVGFLLAAQKQDYARAAQYLDVKKPEPQAEELAEQLQAVLDTGLSANLDSLSREATGNTADNLRAGRDLVGTVKTERGSLDILVERVQRPGQPAIWLFSSETLAGVPRISGELPGTNFEQKLPRWLVENRFLSLQLWRWLLLIVVALVELGIAWAITSLIHLLLAPVLGRVLPGSGKQTARSLRKPVFTLLLAATTHAIARYSLSVLGRQYWNDIAVLLLVIGVAWLLIKLGDMAATYTALETAGHPTEERVTFISVTVRIFKIVVVLCACLVLLSRAGVDVTAMLAGLGIGGIALALAAQKTLEDFFGGITIVARKAVRVGDLCKIGDDMGTIEAIGLSSLKLRTGDRCVVSLPNAKVAQVSIQNFSLRDKFLVHEIFSLRHDTPAQQVKTVIAEIDRVLQSTEAIEKATARVRLIDLDSSGLRFEIWAYLLLPPMDAARCLEAQEQIFLSILKILDGAGTGLAIPGQIASVKP